MNYYDAREIKEGPNAGKFHYTCVNDGRTWAVGYCSSVQACPRCPTFSAHQDCELCAGRGLIAIPSPCTGHETREGACEHYKQFLLDNIRWDAVAGWPKNKCEVDKCEKVATKHARVLPGGFGHELCEVHATRKVLEELVTVGSSMSSY